MPDPAPGAPAPPPGAGPPPGIVVEFKLDPGLTRGLYLGERWVSPPVFSVTLGEGGYVEARARCLAGTAPGSPGGSASWTSADPALVSVSPSRGDEVKLLVSRAGEGTLALSCEGQLRSLGIRAAAGARGTLLVDITQ